MRDDAVLRRALPLGRGLGRVTNKAAKTRLFLQPVTRYILKLFLEMFTSV